MKKTLMCAVAFILFASSAMANVYLCKFSPQQTRGWAPPIMYVDTNRGVIIPSRDTEISYSGSNQSFFWRDTMRSNNGFRQVRFTLQVGQGVENGTPVSSSLVIEVKGTPRERSRGTCELANP